MERFQLIKEPMAGLKIYQLNPIEDERGSLTRFFCDHFFEDLPLSKRIAQINLTRTAKTGTVRGLHFQHPPYTEDKFITCLRGKIMDFVVDLRRHSRTFLQVHYEQLSHKNHRAVLIPKGFAHGFQCLKNDSELLYLHSSPYVQHAEDGINITDPSLKITLPLPISERSIRDRNFSFLAENFSGISS